MSRQQFFDKVKLAFYVATGDSSSGYDDPYARLSIKWLVGASGVTQSTIKRMELVEGPPASSGTNLAKVQAALEAFGDTFIPENGGGGGADVRLRHASAGDEQ